MVLAGFKRVKRGVMNVTGESKSFKRQVLCGLGSYKALKLQTEPLKAAILEDENRDAARQTLQRFSNIPQTHITEKVLRCCCMSSFILDRRTCEDIETDWPRCE